MIEYVSSIVNNIKLQEEYLKELEEKRMESRLSDHERLLTAHRAVVLTLKAEARKLFAHLHDQRARVDDMMDLLRGVA